MQQNGWSPQLILIDTVIADTETVQTYKDLLEGALGAEIGTDPSNPKFAALVENYKARYGVELPYASLGQTEYDAVYLVADAIRAVGYDGTKLADWFHTKVNGWHGASGAVTIQANGDRVGAHLPEVVHDGKVSRYVK
jgi:ABC-type branched-subunit amino acid transport system substrate-binding protein